MQLTVLGCWAPYPKAGGACPGYLLQAEGKNILIDCGNGVISNMQKYIDFRSLDAVLISHFHPDHYMDLFCLRHAIKGARRLNKEIKPLPLYVPSGPEETFVQISKFTDAFEIIPIESTPQTTQNGKTAYNIRIGNIAITFIRTDHPLPTYAMLFDDGHKLFYAADTKRCEYLADLAQGVDVFLCEASLLEADSQYTSVGHLTARQAGELAALAGAKNLMLTHFWPEYNLGDIKNEAEEGYGHNAIVAMEGLELGLD